MNEQRSKKSTVIPGESVFQLYDTFGFPKELTEEYVSDFDFTIDEEGFNKEMENQRARARAARQSSESMQVQSELFNNLNIESNSLCTCIDSLDRSEEHTSELQSRGHLVCRLLLEKKKNK